MTGANDPGSECLAQPSGGAEGDPLSSVLRSVRLTGALFFLVDATSPWCVDIPHARNYARIVLPQAQHIFSYHVIVDGSGFASVPGVEPVAFGSGDILAFPHGDGYLMESERGAAPELDAEQTIQFFRDLAAGRLPFVIPEGGGQPPPAKVICGFLGCDARPFNPLLASLPRLLHLKRPEGDDADLLGRLIELTMAEARQSRIGGQSLRLGLSELMFVELLRRYSETLGDHAEGWLAGLRDAAIGRALASIHARPEASWTVASLAQEAGVSRSVLAERFAAMIGQAPMQYLAAWRMQLAARQLADGGASMAEIAFRVGYASEAAFSRTFKRIVGVSPDAWRRSAGAQGG